MTVKQQVDYWLAGSYESLDTMRALIKSKKNPEALYFGHLAIEKMLKALCSVRRVQKRYIFGHDLKLLADRANFWAMLTTVQQTELARITAFNIEGRYDDYKRKFKAQCTPQYTAQWAKVIEGWCKELKKLVVEERALLPNNTAAV